MSPPASGDARPSSRHAAGGRRAAGSGSGSDPGREPSDSAAPAVEGAEDALGIADWLASAGPAPHETGPLLPGLLGPSDGGSSSSAGGSGSARTTAGHDAATPYEPRRSRDSGAVARAGESAGSAADAGGQSARAYEPRRSRDSGPVNRAAEPSRRTDQGATPPAREHDTRRRRESSPVDRAGDPGGAAGAAPSAPQYDTRSSRTSGPVGRTGESGPPDEQPAPGRRASKHAFGGRRAAGRATGPAPAPDATAAPAVPAAEPVFGTPFWSSQAPEPDPDDPLGLGTPEAAATALAPPTAPAPVPAPVPGPQPSAGRRAAARQADPVVAPAQQTYAFAPAPSRAPEFAPEPEDRAPHTRPPSTRPRRTQGDPPNRATGGALAACLVIAAIIGFVGGAWFGSRPDDGRAGSGSSTGEPGTPGAGEPVPAEGLTIAADPTEVAPNGLVALTGTLAPAEGGVEVTLQHRVGEGEWIDYPQARPLTFTTREDGSFSGSVATDAPGTNFFRVVNVDDPEEISNELEITVTE